MSQIRSLLIYFRSVTGVGLLTMFSAWSPAQAQSTAFSYQGALSDENGPANGVFDFRFALFNLETDGIAFSTITNAGVEVVDGLFTTLLDFGAAVFDGTDYRLEIGVQAEGGGGFNTLEPRQPLTSVPYAMQANKAMKLVHGAVKDPVFFGTTGDSTLNLHVAGEAALRIAPDPAPAVFGEHSYNFIGGSIGNRIGIGVRGATISGGGSGETFAPPIGNATMYNDVFADFGTIGGGLGNRADGWASVIAGGWANATESDYSSIVGGKSNVIGGVAIESTISGGSHNMGNSPAFTIGGGRGNQIVNGADESSRWKQGFSTIGGGLGNLIRRTYILEAWNSIAGGASNTIESSRGSSIGGGVQNLVEGPSGGATGGVPEYSTISGGYANVIHLGFASAIGGGSHNWVGGDYPVIGGGRQNRVDGNYGVIGGGRANVIHPGAWYATIPGGRANVAWGDFSHAAGHNAEALHDGTFIWADSLNGFTSTPFISITNNEFAVRATGGVRFVTGIDPEGTPTSGVSVPSGGTGWDVISDRNMKENFEPVDGKKVLEQVAAMPISRWNMKSQDPSIRHIGPMAQDFHAAFGLGQSDKRINTVDADGVALAAIQGLYMKLEEQLIQKDITIQNLRQAVEDLSRRLEKLETQMTGL